MSRQPTSAPANYRAPCPRAAPGLFLATAADGSRWLEVHAGSGDFEVGRWRARPATAAELLDALVIAAQVVRVEDLADVEPAPWQHSTRRHAP